VLAARLVIVGASGSVARLVAAFRFILRTSFGNALGAPRFKGFTEQRKSGVTPE
jgi:hypothetical protein